MVSQNLTPANRASENQRRFDRIHVVSAGLLAEYLANTELLRSVGNEEFARRLRRAESTGRPVEGALVSAFVPAHRYVAFHSWRPGTLPISERDAGALTALRTGQTKQLSRAVMRQLEDHEWLIPETPDAVLLADRALEFGAFQNRREVIQFLRHLQPRRPRVVVEIGVGRGGTLFALAQLAAPDALIIGIDLPGAPNGGGQTARERELLNTFAGPSQTIQIILGDSGDPGTVQRSRELLGGRLVDLLVIDGDHSYRGVSTDFHSYTPLLADAGLVALHDILAFPDEWGEGNDVGVFWREIRQRAPHATEIIDGAGVCAVSPPPGVKHAWGFGLLQNDSSWMQPQRPSDHPAVVSRVWNRPEQQRARPV